MQISFIGFLICGVIFVLARLMGSAVVIGMIASVAFGCTSAVTLGALGGASPLIYIVFALCLIAKAFLSRSLLPDLTRTFGRTRFSWIVCALIAYAPASAIILPRLFAGATSAFVAARDTGVVEVTLAPTSGNITQTAYFVLGAISFLALMTLLRTESLSLLRKGFFVWATVNAVAGVADLAGKMVGAGDVLMPIRTATFALLTETEQAGFWRITGSYSEASSFAGAALASLAFTFTYWKHSGSRGSLLLAAVFLALLILSTSSTGYVGLVVLSAPVLASMARSALTARCTKHDMAILAFVACGAAMIIALIVYDQHLLDPFQKLFQTALLDKSQSESGRERSYWNIRSVTSFFDTWGLGIGFGSSRSSNWAVAVMSQLGLIGMILQLALIVPFLRHVPRPGRLDPSQDIFALHQSLQACGLALLVSAVIAGGSADPGLLFFVALAGILVCRDALVGSKTAARPSRLGVDELQYRRLFIA